MMPAVSVIVLVYKVEKYIERCARALFGQTMEDIEYVFVDEKMESVMRKFERTDAWNLPVVRHDRTYVGFVSKSKIFSAYRQELREVSQD